MDFYQQQAIYLQIADYICERILRDEWPTNYKITSIREMAAELEVNPNTVARAYSYLESYQIITKQRGVGYFVAKEGHANALELVRGDFLQKELPRVFKNLELLQIPISTLTKLYNNWRHHEG